MTILLSFLFAFYVSSAENQKNNNENKIIKTQNIHKKDSSTNWGEGLTHVAEGGTLTISGTGPMYNYTYNDGKPSGNSFSTIIIQEGVTSIGDYAFSGFNSLLKVQLCDTIIYIGKNAFSSITSSSFSIDIPDSVTYIGISAFQLSHVVNVNLSSSMTSISQQTFYYCQYMTSIEIPEGIVSIDSLAFESCDVLAEVKLPSTLERIDEGAFKTCQKIKTIVIPDNVNFLGRSCFELCSGMISITLPSNLNEISMKLLSSCDKIESLEIPDKVTAIGQEAFNGCYKLAQVTIPSGLTSIGNSAFEYCKVLASIELPVGITKIPDSLFSSCFQLSSVTMHGEVTIIGNDAFSSCNNLPSISLPETVSYIQSGAFSECSSITSMTIPESVTSIGDSAFYGCSNLASINIPKKLTEISDKLFYGCTSIQKIDLPEGIISIGQESFCKCTKIEHLETPNSLEKIGNEAFKECTFRNFTIHENVNTITRAPFFDNIYLETIEVDQNNKNFIVQDGILYNVASGTLVYCPIANKIISLEIPDFVQSINSYAFQSHSFIQTVIIPANVTSINTQSFCMCNSLRSVAYYGEKDPASAYALPFNECPLLKTANVTSKYVDSKFCQLDIVIIDQNDNDDASSIISSDEKEIDSSSDTIFISDDTQNSEGSQQSEQDQTSDNNQNSDVVQTSDNDQNSDGAQTSENIHESENGQMSDDTQNSDNIQNTDEESSSIFVPIPYATPTPKPIIVIDDIPDNVNESELDKILTDAFKNNTFDDNENKVVGFTTSKINFNSDLEPDQFIKPMNGDSEIVHKGGNLNLVLPTTGKVTVSLENEKSSFSINGEGELVIDKADSQSSSVDLASKSRINGSVSITVSEKIDEITIESIEFDKDGSLSVTNNDANKNVNLNVKDVSTKQNSKAKLQDASILNSLTVSQSSTIDLNNVSLKTANINFDLNNNDWTPFLRGAFNDPPQNIFLNRNSDQNSSPAKNEDYALVVGQFEENKCEEWLARIDFKNSNFNSKSCEVNDEKLQSYENKKIVIKSTDKKGKGLTGGQIAGIVIGCVAAVAIVVVVVIIVIKKKKSDNKSDGESP